MPVSITKRGGRAITTHHAMADVFALLVATFMKGAQMCSMGPIVRNSAGAALKVLGITSAAWQSTEILRYVIEPCLRKLGDTELSPYINKLMSKASDRDGRREKTMELLRDIILFFVYHIAQVDEDNPIVDYESFMEMCQKVCPSHPIAPPPPPSLLCCTCSTKWCGARAQARIDTILLFKSIGGCTEFVIQKIIFPSDWDNTIMNDISRIARIPDTIFLTIWAKSYDIPTDEWLNYFLNGGRKLEKICLGTKRRRQTADRRMAADEAAANAGGFAGEEEVDLPWDEATAQRETPQRPQRPGSVGQAASPRGMGSPGDDNGLDPLREGARQSHERHVKQAIAMQSRLKKDNQQARNPPASPCPTTSPCPHPAQPHHQAAAKVTPTLHCVPTADHQLPGRGARG